MSAFRSDLDAARARVDALAAENEELRADLARARTARPAGGHDAVALKTLSDDALERLDRLAEDIEVEGAPVREPSHPPPPEPPRDHEGRPRPHAHAVAAPSDGARWPAESAQLRDARTQLARLGRELEDVARWRARSRTWTALVFGAGVVVGLVLGALAR